MKECFNCHEIIAKIYRELFQDDLSELQKQLPFLRCTAFMSAEQAAVFIVQIQQQFNLPETLVLNMIVSEKFTYNDLCDSVSSFINEH